MAKNEFGAPLDSNGYSPSILSDHAECFLCPEHGGDLIRHEVYHGAYRSKSKRLGTWVWLCVDCHTRLHQERADWDEQLKATSQRRTMNYYNWNTAQFRAAFGKNYTEE